MHGSWLPYCVHAQGHCSHFVTIIICKEVCACLYLRWPSFSLSHLRTAHLGCSISPTVCFSSTCHFPPLWRNLPALALGGTQKPSTILSHKLLVLVITWSYPGSDIGHREAQAVPLATTGGLICSASANEVDETAANCCLKLPSLAVQAALAANSHPPCRSLPYCRTSLCDLHFPISSTENNTQSLSDPEHEISSCCRAQLIVCAYSRQTQSGIIIPQALQHFGNLSLIPASSELLRPTALLIRTSTRQRPQRTPKATIPYSGLSQELPLSLPKITVR